MSVLCDSLHQLVRKLPLHHFPFDQSRVPANGIYILFEKGEQAHQGARIVRVGTHTGKDKLRSRLIEHFVTENKDRSIFRVHIGRAILCRDQDPFFKLWSEVNLTLRANREKYPTLGKSAKMNEVEAAVTKVIQSTFCFVAISVDEKEERIEIEKKLIGTVANCSICRPSKNWLGNHHPNSRIRNSGVWNVVGIRNPGFDGDSFHNFQQFVSKKAK